MGGGNRGRVTPLWFTHRRKRKFFISFRKKKKKNLGEVGESSDHLSESESDS